MAGHLLLSGIVSPRGLAFFEKLPKAVNLASAIVTFAFPITLPCRCLQDNKAKKNFGKACQKEVASYEQETAKDFRLNYRLSAVCRNDMKQLCAEACSIEQGELIDVCGGRVLRCLSDKYEDIKASACQKEVMYYQKMEVTDFRNDVIVAEACRADVDKFCKDVAPGDGRTHKCLRSHMKELTESCREQQKRMEVIEEDNIELSVGLIKACRWGWGCCVAGKHTRTSCFLWCVWGGREVDGEVERSGGATHPSMF